MSERTPLLPTYQLPSSAGTGLPGSRSEDHSPTHIHKKGHHHLGKHNKSRLQPPVTKLGTFDGVFLPTSLNVLSILMFLRFGFIMGQMGVIGTILLLVMSYFIDILTVLSISAISTNGTVRGGGAYYMILRSLGPEFGVAIGIIFFIGQVLNASLNVVGFIEPFLENFGHEKGAMWPLLPVSPLWQISYSTILLAVCTGIAMVGSSLVSKTAFWLFVVLTTSTLSIPVSALFVKPFFPIPGSNLLYTGISWSTFRENLWLQFTSGAAGSLQPPGVPETFRNMFGIFFPATAGIFAGASMSGELKNPSRAIPKGTLWGLLITFILYLLVIVSIGASTPRELLRRDLGVIQTINLHSLIIVLGEFSTSLFSVIMGIVGAASMLNAIANDKIVPGLQVFSVSQKSEKQVKLAQLYGIVFTWFLAQIFLFADINQIATFITMAFSMTFMVTNLACFLLRLGSAPNFRPSFKYFSSKTALTGGVASVIAMYICDGRSATSVIAFLVFLIMTIHYCAPPLKFGDISQLLIYHQVRKYLLRLKLNMSVKYWRPQILLLCDDPRTSWNLIGFCNHLKKGGLYILGHVVIISDAQLDLNLDFGIQAFKEVQRQKLAWVKLRDMAKIKAFVHISIGPSLPWGVRNVFLGSGLGGMKPNITVLGFHDFDKHGTQHCGTISNKNQTLPTDNLRKEKQVSISQWVQIVEDLIIMQATVAVAANFGKMSVPEMKGLWLSNKLELLQSSKKYIDLYPIQMSKMSLTADGKSVLSTNFDTYTLILQLGSILSTVDEWKKNKYTLRIIAFVETKGEEEDERSRLDGLLEKLRIDAEVKVVCLNDGLLETYNIIVSGRPVNKEKQGVYQRITKTLLHDQWWNNLVESRKIVKEIEANRDRKRNSSKSRSITINDEVSRRLNKISIKSLSYADDENYSKSLGSNRRYTVSNLHGQGMNLSLSMRAQGGDFFFDNGNTIESSDESSSERDVTTTEASSNNSSLLNIPVILTPQEQTVSPAPLTASNLVPKPKSNKLNGRQKVAQQAQKSNAASGLKMIYKTDPPVAAPNLPSRPLKVNLRPNFLAVKIPKSKVQEDEGDDADTDGNDDDEPVKSSIIFVDEEDDEDTKTSQVANSGEEAKVSKLQPIPKSSILNKNFTGPQNAKDNKLKFDLVTDLREDLRAPSIISVDMLHEHIHSPHFMSESDEELPLRASIDNRNERQSRDLQVTFKKLQRELQDFLFNKLPPNGQHIILNELMRMNLSEEDTAVIFSTLPAPEIGTHLDHEESCEYTNSLAIWLEDLPPVMLLNSQTVTVTTSL